MPDKQTIDTAQNYSDEVTPESMMSDFRGRPIVGILTVTVIVHLFVVGVFSFGYLKSKLIGEDTSSMSEEERLKVAVQEATTSLREIAERHGLNAQDLTSQFADGNFKETASPTGESTTVPAERANSIESGQGTDGTESAIEKELNTTVEGPAVPDLPPDLPKDEDDLF